MGWRQLRSWGGPSEWVSDCGRGRAACLRRLPEDTTHMLGLFITGFLVVNSATEISNQKNGDLPRAHHAQCYHCDHLPFPRLARSPVEKGLQPSPSPLSWEHCTRLRTWPQRRALKKKGRRGGASQKSWMNMCFVILVLKTCPTEILIQGLSRICRSFLIDKVCHLLVFSI